MEVKNIFKTFILLIDGIWGIIVICLLFLPLWLISATTRAVTKSFVRANTQYIQTKRGGAKARRLYTVLKYLRRAKMRMWKAFDYGYDHLLPIEQRRRSPKRK